MQSNPLTSDQKGFRCHSWDRKHHIIYRNWTDARALVFWMALNVNTFHLFFTLFTKFSWYLLKKVWDTPDVERTRLAKTGAKKWNKIICLIITIPPSKSRKINSMVGLGRERMGKKSQISMWEARRRRRKNNAESQRTGSSIFFERPEYILLPHTVQSIIQQRYTHPIHNERYPTSTIVEAVNLHWNKNRPIQI